MGDPFDHPRAQEWADSVLNDMLPKLRDSALNISIVPDEAHFGDVKFAVELGMSVMLDKPIILAIRPGQKLPDHLVRVADKIVELGGPEQGERLQAAIGRVLGDES